MRLNLDMNILRHMTDGVLVLDRYAQIVAFNKIAEPWAARCQAMSAAIKRLIDEERQGRLVLPIFLDLQIGQKHAPTQRADAWLCKNGRNEYAVFVVSLTPSRTTSEPAPTQPNRQQNLFALMGNEVREQLSILRELMHPKNGKHAAAPGDFAQQCQKVEQLMQEVTDLSQLLESDEVFSSERLSITDIIENILLSLPPNSSQTTVALHNSGDTLGPVYGNGAWLSYALRLLISGLMASAPPRATIELATHQMGDFLILTGRAGTQPSSHAALASTHTGSAKPEPADSHEASIQMMMCKRIIELHAGQLRLALLPPNDRSAHALTLIESFTLTLMTSIPANERSHASCADCRHVRQELAYASDLAQLWANSQTTIPRSL